jgi:hypothetical protein
MPLPRNPPDQCPKAGHEPPKVPVIEGLCAWSWILPPASVWGGTGCSRIDDHDRPRRGICHLDVELVAGARFALVIGPHAKVDVRVQWVVRPGRATDDTGTGRLVQRSTVGLTKNEILEVARDGEPVNLVRANPRRRFWPCR